jgi:Replication-relaxation
MIRLHLSVRKFFCRVTTCPRKVLTERLASVAGAVFPTEAGKRWHLCERGLRLLASANRMHIRNIAVKPDEEAGGETAPVVQRGESWLVHRIQHTAGIYRFFACLAQAAREQPDQSRCWWETGATCERHYRVGEQRYNLRPDALAEYRVGQRPLRFWLEWDCGTMNVRDLAMKFTAYARYLASQEWARERSLLPQLVCIAPDIAQERRMHRVAQARLMHTPGVVVVWTTTEVLLNEHGPLASIWLQGIPQRRQAAQPGDSLRQCLFDVIPLKKGV